MIRYIKLVSGHEIVGEELDSNGHSYTLKKPMSIEMMDYGGHVMCNLVTYCIATDIVEFNSRYVLQTGSASETFCETYAKLSAPNSTTIEPLAEPLYESDGEEDDDTDALGQAISDAIKQTYH